MSAYEPLQNRPKRQPLAQSRHRYSRFVAALADTFRRAIPNAQSSDLVGSFDFLWYHRSMGTIYLSDRITVNPEVCFGKPCIRGMRIRVVDVLDLLAAGANEAEILGDYPYLERDDIAACLAYASQLVTEHGRLSAA
jgi:uncharacterized protein (DUF433 family)